MSDIFRAALQAAFRVCVNIYPPGGRVCPYSGVRGLLPGGIVKNGYAHFALRSPFTILDKIGCGSA